MFQIIGFGTLIKNALLLTVVTLVLAAGAAPAAEAPQGALASRIQAVDDLFAVVNGGETPGAAVGVLEGDRVVLLKGYGMADAARGVAISPQTRFRIGSVTKPLTAIAVLQLVEREKLSLDDSLEKFFPELPFARKVKICHLLGHTAGVPDFIPEEAVKGSALEFEPGTRINYSNTGYHILGRIIERVTGGTWEEWLREQILAPMGMEDTGFDRTRELAGRAAGYKLGPNGAYEPVDLGDAKGAYAAGGVYSTAGDMLRLARGIRDGTLISREMWERASTSQILADGRRVVYGFGWMTREYRGLREVGHGGDIGGFNAYLALYPDEDLAVAVLSNVEMRPPGRVPDGSTLAHKIVDVWLAEKLAAPKEAAPVVVSTETLDRYAGLYHIEAPETIRQHMGQNLRIWREGERLLGEANGTKIPLAARSNTSFQGPNSPVELIFVCEGSGSCQKVVISLLGLREFHAIRIPETPAK